MSNESDYPARIVLESGAPDGYLLEDSSGIIIKELQNYYELVRTDGAVNFWPLSEASSASPAADLLGTNPGTYNNSPTMAQTGPLVGDTSTAITVNGTTQDVTANGSTAYTGESGALTVEGWVKTTAGSGIAWRSPTFSISAGTFAGIDIRVSAVMLNTVSGSLFNQNGGTLEHRVSYVSGDWVHIALTVHVGTTTARMYVNADNTSNTSDFPTDFPVITAFTGTPKVWDGSTGIHIASDGSTFLTGTVAAVAVYPTALTADQIARHYRCGLQYFDSGLGMAEPSGYPQLLVQ